MPIFLVRHSETEWNKNGLFQGSRGSPQTNQGHRQDISLMECIKHYNISDIISSDLKRAQITAKILYNNISCNYIETTLLRERCFGEAEGLNAIQVLNKWPLATYSRRKDWIDFDMIPFAEKKFDFSKRIQAGFKFITTHEKNDKKCIIVVTHACVIEELFIISNKKHIPLNFLPGKIYQLK